MKALYIGLIVLVVIGVLSVVGFITDPFGWRKAHETKLENQVEQSADNASARTLQASGEAAQPQRVEIIVRQPVAASQAALDPIIEDARTATDANAPLPPDRLARLRAADASLCDQSPSLDGCAATAASPARGG